MKKVLLFSVASFILGCALMYFLSLKMHKMSFELVAAVQIPNEIVSAQNSLRLLDEEKYDALREMFLIDLRCGIQSLEQAYARNERFTTPEHIAKVKERAFKYTEGIGCEFPLSE